jgi:hypothetical protein
MHTSDTHLKEYFQSAISNHMLMSAESRSNIAGQQEFFFLPLEPIPRKSNIDRKGSISQ